MRDDDGRARAAILARRARFLAAALAGAGVALPAGAKPAGDDDAEPAPETDAPPPGPEVAPRICLSDIDIDGELVVPPEDPAPRRETRAGPLGDGPVVCLSIRPPWDDSDHSRDGFYLRAAVGGAAGELRMPLRIDFGGFAFDAGGGITVANHVAVGTGAAVVFASRVRFDGVDTGSGYVATWLAGPEVTWMPDPRRGFALGLRVGPQGVSVSERPDGEALGALGFGASASAGTGVWLTSALSLDLALQASGGVAWADDAGVARRLDVRTLAILAGLRWH